MSNTSYPLTWNLFTEMWQALGGDDLWLDRVAFEGDGAFDAAFAVSDVASAVMASVGTAVAELLALTGETDPSVRVNRILSSCWFGKELRPIGIWSDHHGRAPAHRAAEFAFYDGPHRTADDRWVRLHNTYRHHRLIHLKVLGIPADAKLSADIYAEAIRHWKADELELAIREAGGAMGASHTLEEWAEHPQGKAVAAEPIVDMTTDGVDAGPMNWQPLPGRPLAGLRILDMTRVIAGPTASMVLAGLGAEVLRIDSPDFEEPSIHHLLLTIGKRNAILDLRTKEGHDRFLELLSSVDIFIHGYRPGALEGLGLGKAVREQTRPGLVESTLNAWGWTGPWQAFRGFDSNIQVESGIALEAARRAGKEVPFGMPVPVLDYGTGYLTAAAALRGLTVRLTTGQGSLSRCALARTAALLVRAGDPTVEPAIRIPIDGPMDETIHKTQFGSTRRLQHPIDVEGGAVFWDKPDEPLGASLPMWTTSR